MLRFAIPSALLAILTLVGPAFADSAYHTERLALEPVDRAPGGGMVVNIHPNGPNVFARELYSLQGANPDESFQVHLQIWPQSLTCTGTPVDLPTAVIETNGQGNGSAAAVLSPEDVAGLRNMRFSIAWIVEQRGETQYATDCTIVTLD